MKPATIENTEVWQCIHNSVIYGYFGCTWERSKNRAWKLVGMACPHWCYPPDALKEICGMNKCRCGKKANHYYREWYCRECFDKEVDNEIPIPPINNKAPEFKASTEQIPIPAAPKDIKQPLLKFLKAK